MTYYNCREYFETILLWLNQLALNSKLLIESRTRHYIRRHMTIYNWTLILLSEYTKPYHSDFVAKFLEEQD